MSLLRSTLEDFIGLGAIEEIEIKIIDNNKLFHKYLFNAVIDEDTNIICNLNIENYLQCLINKEYNLSLRIFIEMEDKEISQEVNNVNGSYFPYEVSFMSYFFDDKIIFIQENLCKGLYKIHILDNIDVSKYLCDKDIVKLFI